MLATEEKPSTMVAGRASEAKWRAMVLLVVWAISLGYMASRLKVGWVPHDEGTLGLSAERVLQGQLPHRDFDDYTGGLTFVHALAFRVFGVSSAIMRYVLFAFFVPWVPAVFYIASRTGPAISAGVVTLLAVAWSVPNYPGPMPSWYNLYFATWGVAALLRYLESESKWWLFAAGLCGGLSMLAKVTGAYFIAAALLFFVFREQSIAGERGQGGSRRGWLYSATVGMGLAIFVTLLYRTIHKIPGFEGLFFFVFPAALLAGFLAAREVSGIAGVNGQRFRTLLRMGMPFLSGTAMAWVVFLIPYVWARSTHDLMLGLIALPARATQYATYQPPSPLACLGLIPFVIPLLMAYEVRGVARLVCGGVLAIFAGALLFLSKGNAVAYGIAWSSMSTAVPVLIVAGAAILWARRRSDSTDLLRQQQIVLLLCIAALCSLVQFPFASAVYFLYAAPLVIVAAAALLGSFSHPPKLALGVLGAFYLCFVLYAVTPYHLGLSHDTSFQTQRFTLPRAGGLSVEASDVQTYQQLIPFVQAHAGGRFMYAAPDCPEVYFLSGMQSPSRHYFEYAEVHEDHTHWVLERLASLGIKVIAIKKDPRFSDTVNGDLREELEKRYPRSEEIGDFTVRWKEQL